MPEKTEISCDFLELEGATIDGIDLLGWNCPGVCRWRKPFELTLPVLSEYVESILVERTSTERSKTPLGVIGSAGSTEQKIKIYYNDELKMSVVTKTGFLEPIFGLFADASQTGNDTIKVTGDVYCSVVFNGYMSYKLKYSKMPTGVSSYTITRTLSPNGASTGVLVDSPSAAGEIDIFHRDVISVIATKSTDYDIPRIRLTNNGDFIANSGSVEFTCAGICEIEVVAGSYIEPEPEPTLLTCSDCGAQHTEDEIINYDSANRMGDCPTCGDNAFWSDTN